MSPTAPEPALNDAPSSTEDLSMATLHRIFDEIPWLQTTVRSTDAKTTCGSYPIFQKQQLRTMLNQAMPFILPASFHQMRFLVPDGSQLTDALKEQWNAAFGFVYSSSSYTLHFMGTVILGTDTGLNFPIPIEVPRNPNAPHPSAAEFLLEPWVLLQMPFQPALLHQWAVALLTEALTFQKKISQIFSYGCPPKFAFICNILRLMQRVLMNCAQFTLSMYVRICIRAPTNVTAEALVNDIDTLGMHLERVLPIVEFVTSKEVNSVIWAIEELFLAELNAGGETHPAEMVLCEYDESIPIYDFLFWTSADSQFYEVLAGHIAPFTVGGTKILRGLPSPDHICISDCPCVPPLRKVIRSLSEKLLQSKRLGGVGVEEIMAAVENHLATDLQPYVKKARHLTEISNSEDQRTRSERVGVVSNIILLNSEVKVAEFFYFLSRRIFDIVKKVHPQVTIGNSVEGRPNVIYAQPDIESKFEDIFANKEWTWEKILSEAAGSCGTLEEITTEDTDMDPTKVIRHFQTRIRKVALTMAKKHLSSAKAGRFQFFPEQQFVQYLLPCFINCFLGPLATPSKNQTAAKRKCVQFVEKLICSYEQKEYSQILSTEKKVDIQDRDVKFSEVHERTQFLQNNYAVFSKSGELVKTLEYFLVHCQYEFLNREGKQRNGCAVESSSWFIHFDMFLHRAVSILKELSNSKQIQHDWHRKALSVHASVDVVLRLTELYAISIDAVYSHFLMNATDSLKPKETAQKFKDLQSTMPKEIFDCAKKLSCQQLASLFVFLQFGSHRAAQFDLWKSQLQGPGFPFDMTSVLVWSAATKDQWKIKQLVAPMVMTKTRRGKLDDISLVSLDFAKSNVCYKPVLTMISSDGTKVLMKEKGEITFVPVKHCRWCGLIKVEKFRLCSLCEENSDYCDVNYFCSENCEFESLASKHREEHARFFTVKLGLDD